MVGRRIALGRLRQTPSAALDPAFEQGLFLFPQRFLGRHLVRFDAMPEQAVGRVAGDHHRAVFAPLGHEAGRAQVQAPFGLGRTVALHAVGFEQRQHVAAQVGLGRKFGRARPSWQMP